MGGFGLRIKEDRADFVVFYFLSLLFFIQNVIGLLSRFLMLMVIGVFLVLFVCCCLFLVGLLTVLHSMIMS